jgi:6-phosphogluconolactonase
MTVSIVSYEIRINKSIKELAENFAQLLVEKINFCNNHFHLALSGGSTPRSIFEYLAANHQSTINWEKIKFYWGDERCVPPNDPESNYKMANDSLLKHIPISYKNIFRIKGENDPAIESIRYSEIVSKLIPPVNGNPRIDLVMLGLGEDGHTVSLFPDNIQLFNSKNLYEVSKHPGTNQKRITATGRIINNAKQVVFIVAGENKSDKAAQIIEKKNGWQQLPASMVKPEYGGLVWMLDYPAAQKLKNRPSLQI